MILSPLVAALANSRSNPENEFNLLEWSAADLQRQGITPGTKVWQWKSTNDNYQLIPQGGSDPTRSTGGGTSSTVLFRDTNFLTLNGFPAAMVEGKFGFVARVACVLPDGSTLDKWYTLTRLVLGDAPYEILHIQYRWVAGNVVEYRAIWNDTDKEYHELVLQPQLSNVLIWIRFEHDGTKASFAFTTSYGAGAEGLVTKESKPLFAADSSLFFGSNGVDTTDIGNWNLYEWRRYAGNVLP